MLTMPVPDTSSERSCIIAEAGVNHNGRLDLALRMVEAAAQAGADLVKFQTYSAERLVLPGTRKAPYQERGEACSAGSGQDQLDMLRALELPPGAYETLMRKCEACGIGFLSTGFDIESVDMLASLGQTMFKIPSGEITNLPYLRHLGGMGQQILLSTGMASLGEIEAALNALEQAGTPRAEVVVLHCTSAYPAPCSEANLRVLPALRASLGVEVGYSDHTLGIEVAIAAVTLGARVIEKHFTLDRELPGPDHAASVDVSDLGAMVRAIRNVEEALGSSIKRRTKSEAANVEAARKSIVAARAICSGEAFSQDNLTTRRPGSGISPMRWDEVLGRVAARDYQPGEAIQT